MDRFHPAPHIGWTETCYTETHVEDSTYNTKLPESRRTLSPLVISRLYIICNPRPLVCYTSLGASSLIVYTHAQCLVFTCTLYTPLSLIYSTIVGSFFNCKCLIRTRVKLCLVLPSSLTARDILPNDMMKSYLPTTIREVCRGGNVCERGLKIMSVRETRRHKYVRIEG